MSGPTLQMLAGGKRDKPQAETVLDAEDAPKPTIRLTGWAAKEWARLAPDLYQTGRLTTLDASLFTSYCKAFGQWKEAELELERAKSAPDERNKYLEGGMMRTATNNIINHPLVGACNTAAERVLKLAKEFGLTPASRTNIDANKREQDDPRNNKYF